MFSMYGKTEVEVFCLKLGQGPQPHSLDLLLTLLNQILAAPESPAQDTWNHWS